MSKDPGNIKKSIEYSISPIRAVWETESKEVITRQVALQERSAGIFHTGLGGKYFRLRSTCSPSESPLHRGAWERAGAVGESTGWLGVTARCSEMDGRPGLALTTGLTPATDVYKAASTCLVYDTDKEVPGSSKISSTADPTTPQTAFPCPAHPVGALSTLSSLSTASAAPSPPWWS